MTVQEKAIRRKMTLLQLAVELRNITKACKLTGYSRTQFYEIRRRYEIFGSSGLADQTPGVKERHPLRIAKDVEESIRAATLEYPTYGSRRLEGVLRMQGVVLSYSTIYNFWCRENLNTRVKRLLLLEKYYNEGVNFLSHEQVETLKHLKKDRSGNQIESKYSGNLLNQDTFYFGYLKGVGKIYIQVVVDCYCSFAFAKLYTSKLPETACDLLNSRVLPYYESLNIPIHAILTDNGREFCGIRGRHPYEVFLELESIEHRTTKVRHPWTNGFVERMNRTILEEFLQVEGRKGKWIRVEDIQRDLDEFLYFYNFKRQHQGYRLNGKTPAEGLVRGMYFPSLPAAA